MMRRLNRRGFILLEILPALLLLAGITILSFRLISLDMELSARAALVLERESSLDAVWEVWNESTGWLAIAYRNRDASWAVLDFPNEEWLPVARESVPDAAGSAILWRRRIVASGTGGRLWVIEVLDARGGTWTAWSATLAA